MPKIGKLIGHRIKFNQLSFPVYLGILPHEREGLQQLLIDLEIELRPDMPDPHEDVANVLNYDGIRTRIIELAQARHYNLLESLARELLSVFEDEQLITKVRLSVQKPDVYADAAAVGYEIDYAWER
ncbi:MAG: dihydroneopterin aldolase [Rhodospirillaceae bacterium]|jgi:7,8-dihydroneopterin aldolase/epimerase/oxygenase|nr:dihydroneopterin aldolase [Rhodospirillaceae bacterium]MBT4487635.1 dihydroneopterin aldolase [Rhodospirillaceae bacterium]MBT5192581.1 dihydroneopterin aldolase [Rhodospirillaceae bacterium]MBT5895724.1 dihydroneopterin aldolase [Rhodospirillaceae bacterium]MBT7756822.1 dihydroneopterin aldolase [Rhodospirillaceae bacterium]